MDSLNELNEKFFNSDCDPGVRLIAIHQLVGFTGSEEGCELISQSTDLMKSLIRLFQTRKEESGFLICDILVNISATLSGCTNILQVESEEEDLIKTLIRSITTQDKTADASAKILSNLTHLPHSRNTVVDRIEPLADNLKALNSAFQNITEVNKLDYLAMVFCNLSGHASVRSILLDQDIGLLADLLPFINYEKSSVRRAGVVGTFKNCCFDVDRHEWLLKELELLPQILLPLAGGEPISDEETEKLPLDLQYLDEAKEREQEPKIRKDLLEMLNKLCTSQYGREFLRENNAYVILREYHKWEKNKELLLACENVVDILIRTEEEIGRSDLVEGIELPDDLVEKFKTMDNDFVKDE